MCTGLVDLPLHVRFAGPEARRLDRHLGREEEEGRLWVSEVLGAEVLEARLAFPLVLTMVADLEGGRFKVVLGNGEFERVIDSFTSNLEDSVETDFLQFRGMAESSNMLIQARSPARGMEGEILGYYTLPAYRMGGSIGLSLCPKTLIQSDGKCCIDQDELMAYGAIAVVSTAKCQSGLKPHNPTSR
ncbi:hypothetical protein Cgig2_004282 [Carnegiea gigantea]|uniref:Uncharacterized protein n=1 Tax=Carnegiea gigantea TaxID=171969 RepID=A0A9Q1KH03_9CARY|nr:hypothetical protein Cgig2_004282 [Carnegiea gigantea]